MKCLKPTLLFPIFLSACASAPPVAGPLLFPPEQPRALSSQDRHPWSRAQGVEAFAHHGLLVVRADPAQVSLELLNLPATRGSVAQVARRGGYVAMINAAMFATDYATSIGYMRSFALVNNPRFNPKLRGFLLFHPKSGGLPAVKIGGKEDCDSYHSVFQTHRVWDPVEGILWRKGASVYRNIGLVGVDDKNRVLFFGHPDWIDVHALAEKILSLSLNLKGLLYLDGGSHGSVYLDPALGRGWNTGISLPNLLGVRRVAN